jgi:xanthine dehydrogenase accessory factor
MDIFKEIVAMKSARIPAILTTVVEVSGSAPGKPGAKMIVRADGSILGTIGGGAIEKRITEEALTMMQRRETRLLKYELEALGMVCGGGMSVFLEPLVQAHPLIIFGAGHIGSALSNMCKMLGFITTVVDNRPEFASKEKLPWADSVIADDYQKALQDLSFSDTTYVVILTHRHVHDFEILDYCIKQPFSYLGMIGSRKKVANAFEQLKEKGVDEETIKRIHAPIGINIGAESPEEIAVAIAAQLVAVRSGSKIPSIEI